MTHWKGMFAVWSGMKELLWYKINAGRHIDSPYLYYPHAGNPSDGLVVIAHNFVNASIVNSSFEHGEEPKTFCISRDPNVKRDCKHTAIPDGMHYEGIKAGDVMIMGKGAAYFQSHKVEGCNKGWTSLTLSRNYKLQIHFAQDLEPEQEFRKKNESKQKLTRKRKRKCDPENDNTNNSPNKRRKK
eukprot:808133_1